MSQSTTTILLAFLLACPLAAQQPVLSGAENTFLPTGDAADVSLEFHGRMDNDWTSFFGGNDIATRTKRFQDGAELRRARLSFTGRAYDWLDFKASFDFTSSGSGLRDMWVQVDDLPTVGRFRIGHFKEPFGLERTTSSKVGPFLERSVVAGLSPSRNLGFVFTDTLAEKRATWAAGIFREANSRGESQDSEFGNEVAFTGRVTFLPWYEKKGRELIHLGISVSQRQPNPDYSRSNPN